MPWTRFQARNLWRSKFQNGTHPRRFVIQFATLLPFDKLGELGVLVASGKVRAAEFRAPISDRADCLANARQYPQLFPSAGRRSARAGRAASKQEIRCCQKFGPDFQTPPSLKTHSMG